MLDWRSLAISLLMVGVLTVLLRWAFSGNRTSLVERRAQTGRPEDYGLLTPIASPGSYVEGEVLRQRLVAASIRASLVSTSDGPRLMVFPEDESRARTLLAR